MRTLTLATAPMIYGVKDFFISLFDCEFTAVSDAIALVAGVMKLVTVICNPNAFELVDSSGTTKEVSIAPLELACLLRGGRATDFEIDRFE